MRDGISNNVTQSLGNPEKSGLALSYLLGQKTQLSAEQKSKLRLAGLAHIVVASGYHLSIVVNIAKKRFGKISRFATSAGAVAMLLIYISITGFSPSMMRAGIIVLLSLWAWYFGRKFHPFRLLLYAAAITLLIDANLITNVAWQLSFASYAGIVFLSPLIVSFLYGEQKPHYFSSIIIASISAQIFCLPLNIFYFGSISGLAIVSNVLITPTIPIVMLLTSVVGIMNAAPIVFILLKLLDFQQMIIDWISTIPWANLELASNDARVFLLYIIIVIIIALLKWRSGYQYAPGYRVERLPDYDKIYTC